MKICIVGGGLSGLVSALELAGTHQVDLFEKRPIPGGCLGSYRIGDYWIEEYIIIALPAMSACLISLTDYR